MRKFLLFIILVLVTSAMVYSFVYTHYLNHVYTLIYVKEKKSWEDGGDQFCTEELTLNRYRFKKEENLFTLLNNLISGPQNIFLDSVFPPSLGIRKVHLFDDSLVIDFNPHLLELTAEEEELLLTVFINVLKLGFPEIEEMFWLSQGRKINYIKAGYSYHHPISIQDFIPKNGIPRLFNRKDLVPC